MYLFLKKSGILLFCSLFFSYQAWAVSADNLFDLGEQAFPDDFSPHQTTEISNDNKWEYRWYSTECPPLTPSDKMICGSGIGLYLGQYLYLVGDNPAFPIKTFFDLADNLDKFVPFSILSQVINENLVQNPTSGGGGTGSTPGGGGTGTGSTQNSNNTILEIPPFGERCVWFAVLLPPDS